MNAMAWVSVACLFLGAGIGLWGYAQQKSKVNTIEERVQRILDAEPQTAHALTTELANQHKGFAWLQFTPVWMQQSFTRKQWIWIISSTLLVMCIVALFSTFQVALVVPLMTGGVAVFVAWLRWQKLRARLVQQLPSFIDGMVRMVVLGHSTQSAFVMAASAAKPPLSQTVLSAASFTKAGMPIDQALLAATRDLKLQEFNLLAAVIQVGSRFGGRVDGLLERVSNLIRDREQADRELRALSAEVRISAWILSLLPVLVGGAIIMLNANYFMKMWDDPSGRWIGLAGLSLQVLGSLFLYRLARLDD